MSTKIHYEQNEKEKFNLNRKKNWQPYNNILLDYLKLNLYATEIFLYVENVTPRGFFKWAWLARYVTYGSQMKKKSNNYYRLPIGRHYL